MAKQRTKLGAFFSGHRRECKLGDWQLLKDENGHRRFKLPIDMVLSRRPASGIPDVFVEQFLLMDKEKSQNNLNKIDVILENAAVSIFVTDTLVSPTVTATGVTLQDFRLIGMGIEDKREVKLHFNMYLPYALPWRDWACDNQHATIFMEVQSTQMELPVEDEAPAQSRTKKGGKKTAPFDPEAIQEAAKKGTVVN